MLCAGVACAQPVELRVSRAEPAYIDANNNYAETERFSVQAHYPQGHPLAGQVVAGLTAALRIEEWRTKIYDGLFGATALPMQVAMQRGQRNSPCARWRVTT